MILPKLLPILFLFCVNFDGAQSLGCIREICEGNPDNELRACPDSDEGCGNYKGVRIDSNPNELRVVDGVDIKCQPESLVKAPFDGKVSFWRPHAGRPSHKCIDEGLRIEGRGQWQGYVVLIGFIAPEVFGGSVAKGDIIGKSIGLTCLGFKNQPFEPHIQFSLYRSGLPVDPTYHLRECMCSGQICESNSNNNLIGLPFKPKPSDYNGVHGWELECPMQPDADQEDIDENLVDIEEVEMRAPVVYSPIQARHIGRLRLDFDNEQYQGCSNQGVFLTGSGQWQDFEVRLFNVRFLPREKGGFGVGDADVQQGDAIGSRHRCPDSGDSIFIEFRYKGHNVNVTDSIMANKCFIDLEKFY